VGIEEVVTASNGKTIDLYAAGDQDAISDQRPAIDGRRTSRTRHGWTRNFNILPDDQTHRPNDAEYHLESLTNHLPPDARGTVRLWVDRRDFHGDFVIRVRASLSNSGACSLQSLYDLRHRTS